MQRFVPSGPGKSTMRYEVYRNKNSGDEDFNTISDMYKRIMSEDKYLCEKAQKNVNAGVFVNGLLHPEMEKGPLFFQKRVREVVTEHWNREQKANSEIHPAKQQVPQSNAVAQSDLQLCSKVDCCSRGTGKMDEKKMCLDEAIAF